MVKLKAKYSQKVRKNIEEPYWDVNDKINLKMEVGKSSKRKSNTMNILFDFHVKQITLNSKNEISFQYEELVKSAISTHSLLSL